MRQKSSAAWPFIQHPLSSAMQEYIQIHRSEMTRRVAALLHGVTFYSHLHKLSFWPSDSEIMTSPAVRMQSFILRLCHSGQRGQRRPPPPLSEMPGSCQSPANHTVMHMSYRQRLGDGLLSLHYNYKVFFLCVLVEVKKIYNNITSSGNR